MLAASSGAQPYEPERDDIVLATVPRAELQQRDTIRQLNAALSESPENSGIAMRLARIHLDLYSAVGDPRHLGYADAALAGRDAAENELLLLRARLLQARHEFAAARELLDRLVRSDPGEARAWMTLAAVSRIQSDFAVMRNACARLALLGQTFAATTCSVELASLTGRSRLAYQQAVAALNNSRALSPQLVSWGHLVAAGIARRLGDNDAAREHLRTALDLETSVYALVTLADVLLEQERAAEAMTLLENAPAADAIVLRRALAGRMLGRPDDLAGRRIQALQRRGDERHAREEALYALYLADQPRVALAAAQRNWQMQRESVDARLLMEAALAANEPGAAAPVVQWMARNNSDDVRLRRLAGQLGESS